MPNTFYSDFDLATPAAERRRDDEYRTSFQISRDRVLHTSAFRQLQGKTQVFVTGEYDFYRTRLTHSLEVSQIGRAICAALRHRSPHLGADHFIDPDLVEAACLSHDLGHPPFGHAGERSLHRLMEHHGGFEGNAQTLRLLTETIFAHGTRGLNPSRALLDAVLKYKTRHGEIPDAPNHFVYSDQEPHLAFVTAGTPWPADAPPGPDRDALKSVECQIMDWADDTAYSLNDIADGVAAGFITIDRLETWASRQTLDSVAARHVTELADALRRDLVEVRSNRKIGDFIAACSLAPRTGFLSALTHRHALALEVAPEARAESKLYKKIALELVFQSPQLQQLDFKADKVLGRLHGALVENYLASPRRRLRLLPPAIETTLDAAADETARRRRLCDFLASLTDASATRLYCRLFEPHFGGLADLV
jgi:dGTPase